MCVCRLELLLKSCALYIAASFNDNLTTMKSFKLTFTNTSGKIDNLIIDAENEGAAIDLFLSNGGFAEQMISIVAN